MYLPSTTSAAAMNRSRTTSVFPNNFDSCVSVMSMSAPKDELQ